MDDKFWYFFRGSAAASARAARGRADGPPRSTRVRLVAERGPCDVRARVRVASASARARARGGPSSVGVAPWWGRVMCWDCADDARGRARVHACMHGRSDQALHPPRARASARTRHAGSPPRAVGDDAHAALRSVPRRVTQVSLTATTPRPHPRRHPRPSFTLTPTSASPSPSASQAHGARGRAAPDLAGCPDPGPRARRAAASRPRAVHTPCAPARRGLSRPQAGSALRACDPCYGKAAWATRWHWVGERWRLAVTTGCAGVLDATPHARGRVPARHAHSAVGDAHDAPCCAVWQARAAAAPWQAPPGGLGAPPRRARGL